MDLKKTSTFGTCGFAKTSPPQGQFSGATKVLNVIVSFEEALKLNLALEECLRDLNSYKRSATEGKNVALNLTIHLNSKRITVNKSSLGIRGRKAIGQNNY